MCDPISMALTGVVKSVLGGGKQAAAAAQPDPAKERAAAEATAATEANQKLVADKQARQRNVLALGGNGDLLGGTPLGGTVTTPGVPGGAVSTRGTPSPVTSVLGGGASVGGGGMRSGGGGYSSGGLRPRPY